MLYDKLVSTKSSTSTLLYDKKYEVDFGERHPWDLKGQHKKIHTSNQYTWSPFLDVTFSFSALGAAINYQSCIALLYGFVRYYTIQYRGLSTYAMPGWRTLGTKAEKLPIHWHRFFLKSVIPDWCGMLKQPEGISPSMISSLEIFEFFKAEQGAGECEESTVGWNTNIIQGILASKNQYTNTKGIGMQES